VTRAGRPRQGGARQGRRRQGCRGQGCRRPPHLSGRATGGYAGWSPPGIPRLLFAGRPPRGGMGVTCSRVEGSS
jgi:hypothetical protein